MSDTHQGPQDAQNENPWEDWQHQEAGLRVSTLYANQAYVQPLVDGMVKLSFGEASPDSLDPSYHTNVVISARNALQLARIIGRVASEILDPPAPVPAPAPVAAPAPQSPEATPEE